jgi:phage FluMu protein Com
MTMAKIKNFDIRSGPVRHLLQGSSTEMELRWWINCPECKHVSMIDSQQVNGIDQITCSCGFTQMIDLMAIGNNARRFSEKDAY